MAFPYHLNSGKIKDLKVSPSGSEPDASKSATVTFEKETAAKTALLLDNTQLGRVQVRVMAPKETGEVDTKEVEEIPQEEKPRARILAEYLAHGYHISDQNVIYCDNQSAIALVHNPEHHARTKHIDIQYHFVRNCIEDGTTRLEYCPTEDMVADGLTKALGPERHRRLAKTMGMGVWQKDYAITKVDEEKEEGEESNVAKV